MKFSDHLMKIAKWDFIPNDFLRDIAKNAIEREKFEKWLCQDYEFVKCAIRFMGILSSKSPDNLLRFFSKSIYYISLELDKFEKMADKLGINLGKEKNFVCSSYCNFLISSAFSYPFFPVFAIYYCEEKAYYEAWRWVRDNVGESPYMELIQHWSSDEFGEYVEEIEKILNELSLNAGKDEIKMAEKLFIETSKFEKIFWEMAYEG